MKELAVSPKQRVEALLKSLPDDCTLEDVQYQLLLIQNLEERIATADKGSFLSPQDVEKRFNKWLR